MIASEEQYLKSHPEEKEVSTMLGSRSEEELAGLPFYYVFIKETILSFFFKEYHVTVEMIHAFQCHCSG